MELMKCHLELDEYKRREQEQNRAFMDLCGMTTLKMTEVKSFLANKCHQLVANQLMNKDESLKNIKDALNEKYNVIDTLIKTIFDFGIPLPYRCLLTAADSKTNPNELFPVPYSNEYPQEYLIKITNQVKSDYMDVVKMKDIREFLSKSNKNLRKMISELMSYETPIKNQLSALNKFLFEKLISRVSYHSVLNFMEWSKLVIYFNINRATDHF